MAGSAESVATLTLVLDASHWRRHDKAHWAQVLANAANEAAPGVLEVKAFELQDTTVVLHLQSPRPVKQLKKLWREGENFERLRSRFADLGARPEFSIDEGGA